MGTVTAPAFIIDGSPEGNPYDGILVLFEQLEQFCVYDGLPDFLPLVSDPEALFT